MTCNLENTISLQSGQTYETNWDRILYLTSYNPIKLMFFNFPSLSNFNQTVDISGWPPPRVSVLRAKSAQHFTPRSSGCSHSSAALNDFSHLLDYRKLLCSRKTGNGD